MGFECAAVYQSEEQAEARSNVQTQGKTEDEAKVEGGNLMLCKDCSDFHIIMEPIRAGGDLWDLGRAECKKHNLVVDFANHGKLNKLICVEGEET